MNLFKKRNIVSDTDVLELTKIKTTSDLIKEIHNEFNTEVDNLLREVGILVPLPELNKAILSKAERLKQLGFKNTIIVEEANKQLKEEAEILKKNLVKQKLKEAIEYFSVKYPFKKFITEDSVKRICAKYNLIYGEVFYYTGDIPEKNLKELEEFKLDETDEVWCENYGRGTTFLISKNAVPKINEYGYSTEGDSSMHTWVNSRPTYIKASLEIVAPVKDFNTDKMEIKNFKLDKKIEIPDPIVLQPVMYNNNKYYLILTAWGDEASDELVINQNFN